MARPRAHDDALRARLLDAAATATAAHGPDGFSLRALARAAGTSTSAVYSLFGSREALVAAVGREAFRRLAEHLDAAPHTGEPGPDLLALGLAYRRFALDEPGFYRVMFEVAPEHGHGAEEPTFAVLREAVARVRPDDAREGALALWALVHGLVSLELAGLLPGGEPERADRFRAALQHGGPALVASSP